MLVNMPAIDYLTLTSWDAGRTFERLIAILETYALKPPRRAKRMQYRGLAANNVFVGEAVQRGCKHIMLQASGLDAGSVAPMVAHYGTLKCTRIDVQVTVRKPHRYDAARVARRIRDWRGPGKPRRVVLVQSGDSLDTVYIGSRSSRRLIRLYVKADMDGVPHLRLEIEYKRELAERAWQTLREEGDTDLFRQWLLAEVQEVPLLLASCGDDMRLVLTGDASAPKEERSPAGNNTVRWLAQQVQGALIRAMHDHESGQVVRDMVRSWADEADAIEDTLGQI